MSDGSEGGGSNVDQSGPALDPATVEVGDPGPTVTVDALERRDFVKYAGASGDFNPIHYDDAYATDAGHESVIAQGMLLMGYASTMVSAWFGIEHVTLFSTRFESPGYPGDEVVVNGEVTSVSREADRTVVEAEYAAVDGDERRLLSGSVAAAFPADEATGP